MILTIDIGNTAITMGLFTPEGRLQFRGSLKTDKNKTRDQIAIDLLDMFHLYRSDLQGITGAVISSVVPPMTSAMAGAVEQLSGVRPMIVGPGVKTGMNILAEIHNQRILRIRRLPGHPVIKRSQPYRQRAWSRPLRLVIQLLQQPRPTELRKHTLSALRCLHKHSG